MKSALFVQANVAVNTKLTSKVPFLFVNFQFFLKNLVKNYVQFRYAATGKFFLPPPPPVANIPGKKFLGALFDTLKCPYKPVPHQSFDASYAPGCK
jgi:hypothetical protein